MLHTYVQRTPGGRYTLDVDPTAERNERPTDSDLNGCELREIVTPEGKIRAWVDLADESIAYYDDEHKQVDPKPPA